MINTRSPAARRLLSFGDLIATLTVATMISMLLYGVVRAGGAPQPEAVLRDTRCWSDPMSDLAPLACGEHAARIRAERAASEAR